MTIRLATGLLPLASTTLIGAAPPPQERVVAAGEVVGITLNGEAQRLRIDPAAPGAPLIVEPAAKEAGLRVGRTLGIGIVYSVGPVPISLKTAVARVDWGHGAQKQRVAWSTRAFSPEIEGSVGPAGLPEPVVRFQLRPAQPGETTVTLRTDSGGFAATVFGNGVQPTYGVVTLDGEPLRVLFDPYHLRTLATAGAAVRLARSLGGTVSGEAVPTEISFGVERPVRTLTLARPFTLGALSMDTLGVRTADFGRADSIRDESEPIATPDPNEIVVTGKGKKRDTRHDIVSLAADALVHCSSIVFDREADRIHLTCG